MGMFDNYDKNSKNIPCNIFKYVKVPETHYIIEGGTCYNTFKILFEYNTSASVSVIYYQEERITIIKHAVELIPLEDSFIVKSYLDREETSKLADTNLDTFAQVKIEIDDKIIFGEKIKIDVVNTLANKREEEE